MTMGHLISQAQRLEDLQTRSEPAGGRRGWRQLVAAPVRYRQVPRRRVPIGSQCRFGQCLRDTRAAGAVVDYSERAIVAMGAKIGNRNAVGNRGNPYGRRGKNGKELHPEKCAQEIQATQLIHRLQDHIFDGLEALTPIAGARDRHPAQEVYARPDPHACSPPISMCRYVARVARRCSTREEWVKKYGTHLDLADRAAPPTAAESCSGPWTPDRPCRASLVVAGSELGAMGAAAMSGVRGVLRRCARRRQNRRHARRVDGARQRATATMPPG